MYNACINEGDAVPLVKISRGGQKIINISGAPSCKLHEGDENYEKGGFKKILENQKKNRRLRRALPF